MRNDSYSRRIERLSFRRDDVLVQAQPTQASVFGYCPRAKLLVPVDVGSLGSPVPPINLELRAITIHVRTLIERCRAIVCTCPLGEGKEQQIHNHLVRRRRASSLAKNTKLVGREKS